MRNPCRKLDWSPMFGGPPSSTGVGERRAKRFPLLSERLTGNCRLRIVMVVIGTVLFALFFALGQKRFQSLERPLIDRHAVVERDFAVVSIANSIDHTADLYAAVDDA